MSGKQPNFDTAARCEMACAILSATNDGDRLAPGDLWLVQEAVNDRLNELGMQRFAELHAMCTGPGGYVAPWFHGVEHLTHDHDGYVRWKGEVVEHFDFSTFSDPGWREREGAAAEEVGRRCRLLESRGVKPTINEVVRRWPDDEDPGAGNAPAQG